MRPLPRSSLGETLAALTAARRGAPASTGSATGAREGVLCERRGFDNPGALRMLTYRPPGLGGGAPLVLVLHGCTQTAEDYARGAGWISLADAYGFALLCPEQTTANNPNRCFNWFEPEDTRRDGGEAASIRAMIELAKREDGLGEAGVFVTGLSAGGAMSAVLLAAYPEVFAGGAIVAGLPYGAAGNMTEAFGAMFNPPQRTAEALGDAVRGAGRHEGPWPRVSVWHGDADATVKAANGDALISQWADLHDLPAAPQSVELFPGRERRVWHGPDGRPMLEQHVLEGLGHGTPLAASGPDGHGAAGPYLLEAGVSSSLETARFWGLVDGEAASAAASTPPRAAFAEPPRAAPSRPAPGRRPGRRPDIPVAAREPHGVRAVIERALTAAGLMKSG